MDKFTVLYTHTQDQYIFDDEGGYFKNIVVDVLEDNEISARTRIRADKYRTIGIWWWKKHILIESLDVLLLRENETIEIRYSKDPFQSYDFINSGRALRWLGRCAREFYREELRVNHIRKFMESSSKE